MHTIGKLQQSANSQTVKLLQYLESPLLVDMFIKKKVEIG